MKTVQEMLRSRQGGLHFVDTDSTMQEVAQRFLDREANSFLVRDGVRIVGIFTKNDLVRQCARSMGDMNGLTVGKAMSTDLFKTVPEADLDDVFQEMVQRGLHHAPVFEGDDAVGMITSADILLYERDAMRFEIDELFRYIHGEHVTPV